MDLLNVTSDNVGKGSLELALDHNAYEFVDTILRDDRIELDGGTAFTRRIRLDKTGNARWVDPWEREDPKQKDTTYPFTVPWKYLQTYHVYERHQVLMNAGSDEQLFNFVQLQKVGGMEDFCNELEAAMWTYPTSPDDLEAWGIPAWVCKCGTAGAAGFYGGRPDGGTNWSTVAGIAPCTSNDGLTNIAGGKERWRNYCAGYKAVNTGLLKIMRTAFKRIRFASPRLVSQAFEKGNPAEDLRIYTNVATSVELEELCEKRNDAYGSNLMMYEGAAVFKRVPIVETDFLDADTSNPLYLCNRRYFKPIVLTGDYLRESKVYNDGSQHNVFRQFMDLTIAIVCLNRQRQAVISIV